MQKYLFSKIMLIAFVTSTLSMSASAEAEKAPKLTKKDYAYLVGAGIIAGSVSSSSYNFLKDVNGGNDKVREKILDAAMSMVPGLAAGTLTLGTIAQVDKDALAVHNTDNKDLLVFWAAYFTTVTAKILINLTL
jgi:hypothetical protein